MPFILPTFHANLEDNLDGGLEYQVTLKRLPGDLPPLRPNNATLEVHSFEGITSTLYLFVQDDLFYYRTCNLEHVNKDTLEWRHPHNGGPPWWPQKSAQALRTRYATLRQWSKTHQQNKFKADLTALDWPGAVSPADMMSVYDAPEKPPTSLSTLQQALLAACGELCCHAMQVSATRNITA